MASQEESFLKLATQVVNDKNNQYKPAGGDVTLKDFDTMDGSFFTNIVASILAVIDPIFNERPIDAPARLYKFEEFGFSSTYDATHETVFRAARKFFPEGNDTLDLSIFFMPQNDIKRAKQVIIFLTGYFIVSDQILEKFEAEWERLNSENQDKSAIYEELEMLRNTIAEHVVRLQSNKDKKPELDAKLTDLENNLMMASNQLSTIEESCSVAKKKYDEHAIVNKRLEVELNDLNAEKAGLEELIVPSPQKIEQMCKAEMQAVADNVKERDIMGAELKELENSEQFISKIIERAADTVEKFEEIVSDLQLANEKVSVLEQLRQDEKDKNADIAEVNKVMDQLNTEQDQLQNEINNRTDFYESECSRLNQAISNWSSKGEHWQYRSDEIISKVDEIENEISVIKCKTQEKITEIHGLESAVNEDACAYQTLVDEQATKMLTLMQDVANL